MMSRNRSFQRCLLYIRDLSCWLYAALFCPLTFIIILLFVLMCHVVYSLLTLLYSNLLFYFSLSTEALKGTCNTFIRRHVWLLFLFFIDNMDGRPRPPLVQASRVKCYLCSFRFPGVEFWRNHHVTRRSIFISPRCGVFYRRQHQLMFTVTSVSLQDGSDQEERNIYNYFIKDSRPYTV